MSVPVNRYTYPGDDTRGSDYVRVIYPTYESVASVFNRPGPVPVNRFNQIGITNNNALSCHDPREAKSAVCAGIENGDYRFNVREEAQIKSYQSSVNSTGFQPGRAIITGVNVG